jgi:hypothetical protein
LLHPAMFSIARISVAVERIAWDMVVSICLVNQIWLEFVRVVWNKVIYSRMNYSIKI